VITHKTKGEEEKEKKRREEKSIVTKLGWVGCLVFGDLSRARERERERERGCVRTYNIYITHTVYVRGE